MLRRDQKITGVEAGDAVKGLVDAVEAGLMAELTYFLAFVVEVTFRVA